MILRLGGFRCGQQHARQPRASPLQDLRRPERLLDHRRRPVAKTASLSNDPMGAELSALWYGLVNTFGSWSVGLCALGLTSRKYWWAGTGLNRRHQDFQIYPSES
jgi:hypothetical protein